MNPQPMPAGFFVLFVALAVALIAVFFRFPRALLKRCMPQPPLVA
jgi:hypothetical protein